MFTFIAAPKSSKQLQLRSVFGFTSVLLLIRFRPIFMACQRIRFRFFEVRACLVVAALFSLCISSNVGPRFFPLPDISDGPGTSRSEPQREASRQSHCEADSFHVPMMSQTQKRTDREPHQPHPIALALKNALISLNNCRVAIEQPYASSLLTPPALSLFSGRAPPEQV